MGVHGRPPRERDTGGDPPHDVRGGPAAELSDCDASRRSAHAESPNDHARWRKRGWSLLSVKRAAGPNAAEAWPSDHPSMLCLRG